MKIPFSPLYISQCVCAGECRGLPARKSAVRVPPLGGIYWSAIKGSRRGEDSRSKDPSRAPDQQNTFYPWCTSLQIADRREIDRKERPSRKHFRVQIFPLTLFPPSSTVGRHFLSLYIKLGGKSRSSRRCHERKREGMICLSILPPRKDHQWWWQFPIAGIQ